MSFYDPHADVLDEPDAPTAPVDRLRDHVADWPGRSVHHLASLAGCGAPSRHDSAGAVFLRFVAGEVASEVGHLLDDLGPDAELAHVVAEVAAWADDDGPAEIADGAADPITVTRWAEFIDLAAWQEDVSDFDGASLDLTQLAGVALAEIARNLIDALTAEVAEVADDLAAEVAEVAD